MKFNYKRDTLLGFIGGVIMLASAIYSFANDGRSKGIILMILSAVMLCFGIYCLVKLLKGKHN